jgi:HemY protein
VVLYIVMRLIVMVVRLPSRTKRMRSARAQKAGSEAVTKTLLALAGGDSETARRQAQRSRSLLGDTPQTLLLAAYAGRQAGQLEEADTAFNLLAGRKDAAFLGYRGLLQGAIARSDWDAATTLARQAEEVNPGAPWLRAERARLATRAGNWKEALALSGAGDPRTVLGVAAADAEPDSAQALKLAKQAWQTNQAFTPAALSYARRLRERGKDKRALMEVLRVTWGLAPNPALAEFALAPITDPLMRASRVATLAAAAPQHGETYLMRARLAFEVGNLTDARAHAEAAQRAGLDQRRVWLLLADIGERSGDVVATSDALLHAASADLDPQWRCEACSTAHLEWHPVCSNCSALGQIGWGGAGTGSARLQIAAAGDPILP